MRFCSGEERLGPTLNSGWAWAREIDSQGAGEKSVRPVGESECVTLPGLY